MPPHVLVLGGGYVPITLTRELRRPIKRGELDVTVVCRENFHIFNGFVGEMITGRIGPGSMLSPVRRIFAPARIHVAEIESIDLDARKVVTSVRDVGFAPSAADALGEPIVVCRAIDGRQVTGQARGSVTPLCPWYFPPRSL